MDRKIAKLEIENQAMKRKSEDTNLRIKGNVQKLEKLNMDTKDLIEEMLTTKTALEADEYAKLEQVDWFFKDDNFRKLSKNKTTVIDINARTKTEPSENLKAKGTGRVSIVSKSITGGQLLQ